MGQTASAVKEAAKQQSEEAEKTANDSLTALQDLAKTQVKLFRETVSDDKDPNKINIKKMLSDETMIRCGVKMEGDKIAEEIETTYGRFASGDIAKGIGSILSTGLKALFGNASGNSNETSKYFITVGELGFPLRIDILLYSYAFTSDTLIKITKDVVAVSITVSSVDIAGLDDEDLGAMVAFCYGDVDKKMQQSIYDKLVEVRESLLRDKQTDQRDEDGLTDQERQVKHEFNKQKKKKEGEWI